ncbi:sensor histidine kinase [Streptantibioticus ferralitis]|uniref:histidine kinase n=1 Tax=Streptantibioticus ferralitis TaxID=236510 RepID=A0ABT5ZBZ8_9ACTN|nr:histidine kinase [Streptantibioticus ferralitis]MDF2261366.1 histidine kinase [Streptantibioticus ferralitis]
MPRVAGIPAGAFARPPAARPAGPARAVVPVRAADPGRTLGRAADPALALQVSALQALCRQVFGFRLAMLAVASPIALLKVAPGPTAWIAGSAVVITFMGAYVLFRDWERFGPLLLRHPALLAVDTLFAAVLLTVGTPESPLAYVTISTPLLAGLVYGWRGSALFTTIQILVVAGAASVDVREHGTVANSLLLSGFCVIAGVVGVSLRRLMLGFGAATRALTETRYRLAVTETVVAERARLAREMHDSVAKTLRGVTMAAEALADRADRLDPQAVRDQAELIARAARRAAAESRELLGELRRAPDPVGTECGGTLLAAELSAGVDAFASRTGLPTELRKLDGAPLPLVPRPIARQLNRIVLEALENAHRHADASRAEVAVGIVDRLLRISVTDDGRGLPPGTTLEGLCDKGHFGVVGMVERAAGIGARLRIGRGQARGGTEVRLELPVAALLPRSPNACEDRLHKGAL